MGEERGKPRGWYQRRGSDVHSTDDPLPPDPQQVLPTAEPLPAPADTRPLAVLPDAPVAGLLDGMHAIMADVQALAEALRHYVEDQDAQLAELRRHLEATERERDALAQLLRERQARDARAAAHLQRVAGLLREGQPVALPSGRDAGVTRADH